MYRPPTGCGFLPDVDPDETREWLDSLDGMLTRPASNAARFCCSACCSGPRAAMSVPTLRHRLREHGPTSAEPSFPGDE